MFKKQNLPPSKAHMEWKLHAWQKQRKFRGWKVGPNWGFITHWSPFTKPCREHISEGKLTCVCSISEYANDWTGYVPVIDERGERLVFTYGRDSEERVSAIPFGAEVCVSKENYKAAPIRIVQDNEIFLPCPWISAMKHQEDIRPFLLRLWKDEELKKLFGDQPELIPLPESYTVTETGNKPTKLTLQKLGEIYERRGKACPIEVVTPPSKNGVHKTDKPKE